MTATGTPTQPHTDPLASFPNGAVTSRDADLCCGELEASPVSPPNWAGLARALYTRMWDASLSLENAKQLSFGI